MNKLLYFSYGSNISVKQIHARVGYCRLVSDYRLEGYELCWNGGPYGGYANIRKSETPGAFVQGVLYDLTEIQVNSLDYHEGYPRAYEKFYIGSGGPNVVYGYWNLSGQPDRKPSLAYLNIVINACFEQGLKDTYLKLLEFKNKNYALLKKAKSKL